MGFKHQRLSNTSLLNKIKIHQNQDQNICLANCSETFKVATIKLRKRLKIWKLKNKADLKNTSTENFDTATWNQIEASRSLLSLRKLAKILWPFRPAWVWALILLLIQCLATWSSVASYKIRMSKVVIIKTKHSAHSESPTGVYFLFNI